MREAPVRMHTVSTMALWSVVLPCHLSRNTSAHHVNNVFNTGHHTCKA